MTLNYSTADAWVNFRDVVEVQNTLPTVCDDVKLLSLACMDERRTVR